MLLYHREGSGGRAERKIDGMQKNKARHACLLNKSKPKCHHAEFIMIVIIIIIIHFTSAQVAEICSEMHWRTRV